MAAILTTKFRVVEVCLLLAVLATDRLVNSSPLAPRLTTSAEHQVDCITKGVAVPVPDLHRIGSGSTLPDPHSRVRREVGGLPPVNTQHNGLPQEKEDVADCEGAVRLEVGSAVVDGATPVSVPAIPASCGCSSVELQVLQRTYVPCAAGQRGCSWFEAYNTDSSSTAFNVSVPMAGEYRAVAQCGAFNSLGSESRRVQGLDARSWNVSIAAARCGSKLRVWVIRQWDESHDSNDTGSAIYFPRLTVSIYSRPPGDRWRRMIARNRDVPFVVTPGASKFGAEVEFEGLAMDDLDNQHYQVDVRPCDWVCDGNNDGCQRRWVYLNNLLELARATPGAPPECRV